MPVDSEWGVPSILFEANFSLQKQCNLCKHCQQIRQSSSWYAMVFKKTDWGKKTDGIKTTIS